MKDFNNKVAVITGGGSGIGFAIAKLLGKRGAKLVIADIQQSALDEATESLAQEAIEAIGVNVDIRDRQAVHALADTAWNTFGAVHFVMHNAGVAVFGAAWELTETDWDWTMQVNLDGVVNGVLAFLPRMVKEGHEGHMLFTASFAGLVPNRNLAPYNISKAAVVSLAESLHKDLKGTKLSASVLCPMRVATQIEQSARNRPDELGGPEANRSYTEEEQSSLQGRSLEVDAVAEHTIQSVERGDLYIHTHKEAAEFVRRRGDKIWQSFENAL